MPGEWTRIDRSDVSPLARRQPVRGTDVGAVIAELEAATSTVRLYHVELVPGYRKIGDEVLATIDGAFAGVPQPTGLNTAIFFGSPGAVVPAHIDRHHNLLLQLQGTKRVNIGKFPDADRQQREVERDFCGDESVPTELPPLLFSEDLGPGDGVYIPPYAFHWTESSDDVSIAVSVGWRTKATDRAVRAHECNVRMRQRHLSPRPVGSAPARDRIKAVTASLARRVRG